MKDGLIKSFTVGGLAMATCMVLTKCFQHKENREKTKMLNNELEREHELALAEVTKNGKQSDETLNRVNRLQKKL